MDQPAGLAVSVSPTGAWVAWWHDYTLDVLDSRTGRVAFSDPAADAYPTMSTLDWSPNGDRFVYWQSGGYLMVSPRTGQVTSVPVGFKQWSRDGARIAYNNASTTPPPLEQRCNAMELYTSNADGSDAHQIASGRRMIGLCGDAAWSPDSERVVYATSRFPWPCPDGWVTPDTIEFWTARRDGSDARLVAEFPAVPRIAVAVTVTSAPACRWAPKGDRLLIAYANTLYSMRGDGSDVQRFTTTYDATYGMWEDWSADGSRFTAHLEDGFYTLSQDGSDRRAFPHAEVEYVDWTWAPTGADAAYQFIAYDPELREVVELWNEATGRTATLNTPYSSDLVWSPNGTHLAYGGEFNDSGIAYSVVRADGSDPRPLSPPPSSWLGDEHVVSIAGGKIEMVAVNGSSRRFLWENTADNRLVVAERPRPIFTPRGQ
jgi:hypothetical protein